MIGGVKESKAASAQDKRVEDTTTVKKLLEDIGVAATPESVQRVGKPNEEKPRILLVKLPNMKEKGQILKSAYKLGKSTESKNFSIRPDLTPKQQQEIRNSATS